MFVRTYGAFTNQKVNMMATGIGSIPPGLDEFERYKVNRPGQVEAIYQPLYDFQTRAATGVSQQRFFQEPIGQSSKTLEDTNMELSGQIPAGQSFLVTDIQVVFFPGASPVQTGTTVPPPGPNWDDSWDVLKAGYLDFFIGSKSYLQDGPLMKFPAHFRMAGGFHSYWRMATDADQATVYDYATHAGPVYKITPIQLMANQNFNVSVNYPGATVNITNAGRIGVILGGFMYRLSQ